MATEQKAFHLLYLLLAAAAGMSGVAAQCQINTSTIAVCLAATNMTSVPQTFNWSIAYLVITDANISTLSNADIHFYKFLTFITISSSAIQTVLPGTFEIIVQTYIDLSYNPLGGIIVDISWVLGLTALETLRIRGSTIQSLYVSITIDLPALSELDLTGQPLHCNCDLLWLQTWAISIGASKVFAVCASPSSVAGLPITSVPSSMMTCSAPNITTLTPVRNQNYVVHKGDLVTLNCTANADSAPTVMWTFFSTMSNYTTTPLRLSDVYQINVQTIASAQRSDSGLYVCTAVNNQGNATAWFILVVVPPTTSAITSPSTTSSPTTSSPTTFLPTTSSPGTSSPTTSSPTTMTTAATPPTDSWLFWLLVVIVPLTVIIVASTITLIVACCKQRKNKKNKVEPKPTPGTHASLRGDENDASSDTTSRSEFTSDRSPIL